MQAITVTSLIIPAIGIILNFFLLFVIFTEKRLQSRYSSFLIVIVLYNIFYALCNLAFDPVFINDEHGYTMFSSRFISIGPRWSYWAMMAMNMAFVTGFGFAAVHTLYRYCTITQRYTFIFETTRGICCVICFFITYNVMWLTVVALVQQPNRVRLGNRGRIINNLYHVNLTDDGFVGPQYWDSTGWRLPDCIGAFVLSCLSGGVFNTNAFITFRLHRLVKLSVCSRTSRNIQMQLVQILATQLFSTLISEIIPFVILTVGGFFGLSFLGPYTGPMASMFPVLDVLIVIGLVRAFRLRAMEIVNIVVKKTPGPLKASIFTLPSATVGSMRNSVSAAKE